ncbi:hypothetical protein HWV62_16960 [Athelia sp. TMB]|nr:hypothetical protein HWV62_16960 [Athelia sp. TMB]
MAVCTDGQCAPPKLQDKLPIEQKGLPQPGEVFMACAAMKHPFLEQMHNSGVTVRTYQPTVAVGDTLSTKSVWRNGVKPCIIRLSATDKQLEQIYLIQFFPMSKLPAVPAIVRHYLIPIHAIDAPLPRPSNQDNTPREHLHTTPPWAEGSNQWVLGMPCYVQEGALGRRVRRSPTKDLPNGSHYYIDSKTMERFDYLCAAKDEEWSKKRQPEQDAGMQELSAWKTKPKRTKKTYVQHESISGQVEKGASPDSLVAQLKGYDQRKLDRGSSKLGDGASVKSKASGMPLGGIRVRKFFRRMIGGGWSSSH